jgi:hypothetical protein
MMSQEPSDTRRASAFTLFSLSLSGVSVFSVRERLVLVKWSLLLASFKNIVAVRVDISAKVFLFFIFCLRARALDEALELVLFAGWSPGCHLCVRGDDDGHRRG